MGQMPKTEFFQEIITNYQAISNWETYRTGSSFLKTLAEQKAIKVGELMLPFPRDACRRQVLGPHVF